ncbi:hypothetical protein BGZ68_002705, partial [Mortierella alpina]
MSPQEYLALQHYCAEESVDNEQSVEAMLTSEHAPDLIDELGCINNSLKLFVARLYDLLHRHHRRVCEIIDADFRRIHRRILLAVEVYMHTVLPDVFSLVKGISKIMEEYEAELVLFKDGHQKVKDDLQRCMTLSKNLNKTYAKVWIDFDHIINEIKDVRKRYDELAKSHHSGCWIAGVVSCGMGIAGLATGAAMIPVASKLCAAGTALFLSAGGGIGALVSAYDKSLGDVLHGAILSLEHLLTSTESIVAPINTIHTKLSVFERTLTSFEGLIDGASDLTASSADRQSKYKRAQEKAKENIRLCDEIVQYAIIFSQLTKDLKDTIHRYESGSGQRPKATN